MNWPFNKKEPSDPDDDGAKLETFLEFKLKFADGHGRVALKITKQAEKRFRFILYGSFFVVNA